MARLGAPREAMIKPASVACVLLVEDEPAISESLGYALGREGIASRMAFTLAQADEELSSAEVDLIVLDLMLPDGSGFDFLGAVRSGPHSAIPVVALSSRDQAADRVRALELGADDYVIKPFSPREVVLRVQAVLRRLPGKSIPPRQKPSLQVNLETRRALLGEVLLDLTRVEFDLLALFLGRPDRAFSRAEIIDQIWGSGFALSDRTIDSHIKALRKKVADAGGDPQTIETVRGIGYRFSFREPE